MPHFGPLLSLFARGFLCILLSVSAGARAAADSFTCRFADARAPATLHLVTVAPGDDLFSSMGHDALVFSGGGLESPIAFDWGAYDTRHPDPITAFLTGELPYFLNVQPLSRLERTVRAQDRLAVAQQLRVPSERIEALYAELRATAGPDRGAYAYHWGTANCATRARDALDRLTDGALAQQLSDPVATTARHEALRHLWRWPLLAYPWRFITSRRLDQPLTEWDRTMIPEHLHREVAGIVLPDGPLVTHSCTLVDGSHGWAPKNPPETWVFALPGLLGSTLLVAATITARRRVAGGLILFCSGVLLALGIPSLVLWSLSSMDGIGPTENWLLAGPQSAVFTGVSTYLIRKRPVPKAWIAALLATGALALGVIVLDLRPNGQVNGDIVTSLLPAVLTSVWAGWMLRDP